MPAIETGRPFLFLIVEIDSAARAQLEGWIRDAQLGKAVFATDVRETLNALENEKVDCVIGTWDLLGIAGGLSLLKLIKYQDRFRHIAFVMVSSPSADEAEKVRLARAARADGYLLKPLNEAAVKTVLEEIRAKHS